jgi:hypothetical protein
MTIPKLSPTNGRSVWFKIKNSLVKHFVPINQIQVSKLKFCTFENEQSDWIPQDIVVSIFQHLDLKTLFQVQLVSKKW